MLRLLILLLLTSCVCAEPAELLQTAQEFRRLRQIKGHFKGGTWDKEVDSAQGAKGHLMGELGQALGKGDSTEERVLELMGPPDDVVKPGSLTWHMIRSVHSGQTRLGTHALLYEWRGRHDFLFFMCDDRGRVMHSDWWAALE